MKNLFHLGLAAFFVVSVSIRAKADEGHSKQSGQSIIGKPIKSAKVSRTIKILLDDNMRITPEKIVVQKGEVIRLAVTNHGKIRHELIIGSAQEVTEHAEMMKQMPEMKHSEANQVTLEPGKTASMVWQFSGIGSLQMACFQAGHYEAGMKGEILVQ